MRYGKSDLFIEIEEDRILWVIAPKKVEPVSDEMSVIVFAIDHPVGDKDIHQLVKHKLGSSVALLVDDGTRTNPHKQMLPVVLERLNSAGIPDRNITAIIAVGTHRKLTDQEVSARFGKEIRDRISFINSETAFSDHILKNDAGFRI